MTATASHLEGMLRVAVALPPVRVADVRANCEATLELWRLAHEHHAHVVYFPELGLTGYTAGDLHLDTHLGDEVAAGLRWLAAAGRLFAPLIFVGAPVWRHPGVYNAAVALHRGQILGVVPKTFLPNYGEFYERRYFRSGAGVAAGDYLTIADCIVPFGTDLLFDAVTPNDSNAPPDGHPHLVADEVARLDATSRIRTGGEPTSPDWAQSPSQTRELGDETLPWTRERGVQRYPVGVEICEDGWLANTPGARLAAAGALVVGNLSGSPFSVGKGEERRLICWKQSAPNLMGYAYAGAGPGESSADLAFDSHGMIFEAGECLAESVRFSRTPQLLLADLDCDGLRRARARSSTFGDHAEILAVSDRTPLRHIAFDLEASGVRLPLHRHVDPTPFVPTDQTARATRCWEVFEIQTNALITRMRHFDNAHLVLALSGGRDSTLAALVCVSALDQMGVPRTNLTCVGMPGWGTSEHTRHAGRALAIALGASFVEEGIGDECLMVLEDQGHPAVVAFRDASDRLDQSDRGSESVKVDPNPSDFAHFLAGNPDLADVELENVQARVRKLRVLTRANRSGALEVGTGDLSEKALGWSTFAGDQTALYDVNCGVPKTLVSAVIQWVATERVAQWSIGDPDRLRVALAQVLDAPISPELRPTGIDGGITQLTEATIGPFILHDFFLHQLVGRGARPSRIFAMAQIAFAQDYPPSEIRSWLRVFLQRFFRGQWKRDATPDGPKVLAVALSPRGDWRMPADAVVDGWIDELDHAPILVVPDDKPAQSFARAVST